MFDAQYMNNNHQHFYGETGLEETILLHDFQFESTVFDSLTFSGKSILVLSLLTSLVIGSYFKSSLHLYMYSERDEIMNKPIDLLILVQALIEHLVSIFMASFYIIGVTFNITYSDYFGEIWCNIPFHASTMGMANRVIFSLAIAILRLFYVKFPYKVRDDRFRKIMMFTFLFLSITGVVNGGIIFGLGNGPSSRKQVLWNFCVGQSETFREIVDNYSMATGATKPMPDIFPMIASTLTLTYILMELLCYILLFAHLYSHDEELLKNHRLPLGEINKRHRRNATSFLGQFYGFVVKTILTSGMVFTLTGESGVLFFRMVIVVFLWVEFGIIAFVEVMTSQNLRQNLPHIRYHSYFSNHNSLSIE